jgi:putative tricarboxylic transport membrane protein
LTTERSLRSGEGVLSGGVLALGAFIAIETYRFEVGPSNAAVGPRLFPFLIAIGLIVVGLALLRQGFFGHIAHEGGFELDWLAVALVSGGLMVQLLLLEPLGWIIATTLLFIAVARAFGSRRPVLDAAIGLALSGVAFVAFTTGLSLDLPAGIIGDMIAPAESAAP